AVDQNKYGVSVRGDQDAHGEPATFLNGHIEGNFLNRSVGQKILVSHGFPVPYQFNAHFAGVSDARTLEMPVRCLIYRTIMDIVRWAIAIVESVSPEVIPSVRRDALGSRRNGTEVSRNLHSSVHRPCFRESHLARIRSHLNIVHAEVHQMAPAIGHVASAGLQRLYPAAVTERPVHLGIDTPLPDAGVWDARVRRLSGETGGEADVR